MKPAAGSGARRGEQVLRRLRERPPTIWYRGELVKDPTVHPALQGGVRTLAKLYDLQWKDPQISLYDSPTSGRKVARSFMMPRTHEELVSISRAMKVWADHTHGMMGRVPDYINRAMTGYAAGAQFLAQADPRFGDNAIRYYEYLRENDLCLTHTLIPPQANRAVSSAQQADPFLAARIKEETDAGIVIRGCRMLATLPVSDEIMVFPSTLLKNPEEDAPYAFGFSIPNNTEGLRFICRESVDYGRSHFDHPLGSRFEEMDAVVVFDDVFVPWENVVLYRDIKRCNEAYARTGAVVHMTHQVVVKNIAKCEFMMGLASLMVNTIGAESFQHIHEKLAEIWVNLETMKAFLRCAEVDAQLDEWGVMRPAWNPLDAARNLFPRLYPRMVEIIQQIGASGLVAMPTELDLKGPLAEDIKKYYQAARAEAFDRIPMFRLAWDASISAFAGRQVLYERFFFGDPVRMAGALVTGHNAQIQQYAEQVRAFVNEARDEALALSDATAAADVRRFRDTIGLFATGVAVIVAHTDKEVLAMTANAVSSVSLDPVLVMFCPAKQSNMARHLAGLIGFTVNILRHDQQALSTYFAGGWTQSAPPPFRLVASRYAPRLEGSLASIECTPWKTIEMGDHWLVFGQVVGLRTGMPPYDPLVFLSGQYRQVQTATSAPAPDLSDVKGEPAHIYYE